MRSVLTSSQYDGELSELSRAGMVGAESLAVLHPLASVTGMGGVRLTVDVAANWRIRRSAAGRFGLKPATLESRMARLGIQRKDFGSTWRRAGV